MIKKLSLVALLSLGLSFSKAQVPQYNSSCATDAPPAQWDNWFNAQVETFVKNLQAGKGQLVNYTIPVIVHVIHFGEAYGTFPNIDSTQIKSQIQVWNEDYNANGAGLNNVPSYFANLVANTGLHFCRATQNPQGVNLNERGVDRQNCVVNSWLSPANPTLNLKAYFNSVIIPATQWDPAKYFNVWVSDKPATQSFNGFATYPSGTSIFGLFNGQFGTSTNDGIWCWAKAFGKVGTLSAPYDQGRTATHEVGHWLGLRHIWGDGNCLPDYCTDTPPSKGPHSGCVTSTPIDACGVGLSPNGEMPMNFMDEGNDACRYMFTLDQNIRIQTAMSQCANRSLLGTHGICTATLASNATSSAIASFDLSSVVCMGAPVTPFNNSSGYPNPSFIWGSSPAANFLPSATVPNPGINFANPGTYTLTLVATNSISSSSYSMVVTASGTCSSQSLCMDSIKIIKNIDSLKVYKAPNSQLVIGCQSGFAGFLTGTNCYKDKAYAQYFAPNTYTSVYSPQVNSAIVFFDSLGTKGPGVNTPIVCKVYGGNVGTGPGAVAQTAIDYLGNIATATNYTAVTYLGKSGVVVGNTKIIPYTFNFPSPAIINPSSGFFVGVEMPYLSYSDSVRIVHNTRYNSSVDSSAWFLQFSNTWRTFRMNRSAKIQLGIIPIISCSPVVGLKEMDANISSKINIMPNPSEGIFHLVFTLPKAEEVEILITNSLGQEITKDKILNVSNQVFDLNLSNQSNGVYFAQITAGSAKTVKKIVVNR